MAVNLDSITRSYFYFDDPVPYKLSDDTQILISPISLKFSEIFLSSIDILMIDKNSIPDAKIIQMSYLKYIFKILLADKEFGQLNKIKLCNILFGCLGLKQFELREYSDNKIYIYDKSSNIKISEKQFDEIKTIILHQNFYKYDDSYINPEVKQAMNEVDEEKNKEYEIPNLERRIAIISSHTGITKKDQLQMTYRSHSILFDEVCGEIDYTTVRSVALFTGQDDKIENWIYKKHKNKFDNYFVSTNQFSKSMGGNGNIKSTDTHQGDLYNSQLNSFNK